MINTVGLKVNQKRTVATSTTTSFRVQILIVALLGSLNDGVHEGLLLVGVDVCQSLLLFLVSSTFVLLDKLVFIAEISPCVAE
jgi:hypothetical protein